MFTIVQCSVYLIKINNLFIRNKHLVMLINFAVQICLYSHSSHKSSFFRSGSHSATTGRGSSAKTTGEGYVFGSSSGTGHKPSAFGFEEHYESGPSSDGSSRSKSSSSLSGGVVQDGKFIPISLRG